MKQEKPIKAWAVINKITGYILWGRYGYFITLNREAARELKNREMNKRNFKIVPVTITLNHNAKK